MSLHGTLEWGKPMDDRTEKIRDLLQLAGETHHAVYRISEGADDDWASWYSDWLVNLSELPDVLGARPIRSELTYLLVKLAKDHAAEAPDEPWPVYYARGVAGHFPQ